VKLYRAILLAIAAPSCGTDGTAIPDATADDPTELSDAAPIDATDARITDGGPDVALPPYDGGADPSPPDGCVITGKPGADVFVPCDVYVEFLNSASICGAVLDGGDAQPPSVCAALCDPTQIDCWYVDLGDGGILSCGECGGGRLHTATRARMERRAVTTARAWLARAAFLEAASVDAFHVLARDLGRLGAPASLRRAARRAAADEVRHARAMRGLALRLGARPGRPVALPVRPRSLVAVATENAIEGCVSETFGVVLATWQARHARDGAVRRAMRSIARDELRHAELAWTIATWADGKLTRAERLRVHAARDGAVSDLERSLGTLLANDDLGLPDARSAAAMLDSLRATTFSATRPSRW
jgi:hypothetical protein